MKELNSKPIDDVNLAESLVGKVITSYYADIREGFIILYFTEGAPIKLYGAESPEYCCDFMVYGVTELAAVIGNEKAITDIDVSVLLPVHTKDRAHYEPYTYEKEIRIRTGGIKYVYIRWRFVRRPTSERPLDLVLIEQLPPEKYMEAPSDQVARQLDDFGCPVHQLNKRRNEI